MDTLFEIAAYVGMAAPFLFIVAGFIVKRTRTKVDDEIYATALEVFKTAAGGTPEEKAREVIVKLRDDKTRASN